MRGKYARPAKLVSNVAEVVLHVRHILGRAHALVHGRDARGVGEGGVPAVPIGSRLKVGKFAGNKCQFRPS